MIGKLKLTTGKAQEVFEEISKNKLSFEHLGEFEKMLRNDLIHIHKEVTGLGFSKDFKPYSYDLNYAISLYEILRTKYQFNERMAAQDNIWRYISLYLIPDVISERYGWSNVRFYKSKRRIWPKSLWWYIHLSWQGSMEATYEILQSNSTDEIVQLVERAGGSGYRVDFSRELMKQFSILTNSEKKNNLFRKIMKLNTMRVKVVEPALLNGGNEQYVRNLIDYFIKSSRGVVK